MKFPHNVNDHFPYSLNLGRGYVCTYLVILSLTTEMFLVTDEYGSGVKKSILLEHVYMGLQV